MSTTAELSMLPAGEQRQAPRRILNLSALSGIGAKTGPAVVLDISTDGCKLQTDMPMEVGALVWIKLARLEAKRSSIVWVDGNQAGCHFEVPFYEAELNALTPARPARQKRLFGPA